MKIRIFGATASGKSTLSKYLGQKLELKVFSTDKVKYPNTFETEIPEKDRKNYIQKNIKDQWIVEGVHYEDWCKTTYEKADIIVILQKPIITLIYRIIKRTLRNKQINSSTKRRHIFKLIKMIFKYARKEDKIFIKIAKKSNKTYFIVKHNNYKKTLERIQVSSNR